MTKAAVDVYVSAGSNIDPEEHLRVACRALEERFGDLSMSSVYLTRAVGFDGDDFLNLVLHFRTSLDAHAVNSVLEGLETGAGRDPAAPSFAPRTLDLDLLLYGDKVIADAKLRVPRADILDYAFVLGPLAELAPELRHPVEGRTMRELWATFPGGSREIRRLDEPLF